MAHYYTALTAVVLLAFIAANLFFTRVSRVAASVDRRWTSAKTFPILTATATLLFLFTVHYGNLQFGAFDDSVLIDTAWRLANGQHPYSDFLTPLPPAFLLGAGAAFRIFGIHWDSQLYNAGLFNILTFSWTFFLLRRLLASRAAAWCCALCIQCAATLPLCFWSYSSLTAVSAAVFFLSCLAYAAAPASLATQASFALSLFLLCLMKPNTAFSLIAGALGILLMFGPGRLRVLYFSLAAFGSAAAFLALSGISIPALIRSYADAAHERGGLGGLQAFRWFVWQQKAIAIIGFVLLCYAPFLRWMEQKPSGRRLLLALAPTGAALAMTTNYEPKYVDMALLVCFGAVVLFSNGAEAAPAVRRHYAAILCALAALGLFTGIVRQRVELIGEFFDPNGAHSLIGGPFFPHLRTGPRFLAVIDQLSAELNSKPSGPVFFGPRMEFGYAAYRLPSPLYLPLWWHPGTSFPRDREPAILEEWKRRQFQTLIFSKDDFTSYSPAFLGILDDLYARDDRYSALTVLRRKKAAD